MSKTLLVEIRNIAIGVIILGAVQVLVTLPTKFFGLSAIFGTLPALLSPACNNRQATQRLL